jgi:hypothetical protein
MPINDIKGCQNQTTPANNPALRDQNVEASNARLNRETTETEQQAFDMSIIQEAANSEPELGEKNSVKSVKL